MNQQREYNAADWEANLENPLQLRAYHYMGLEDDPERVVYNVNNAEIYVKDWLAGIDVAHEFVVKAIREKPYIMLKIFHGVQEVDAANKLLELISKYRTVDDVQFIADLQLRRSIVQLKSDILSSTDPTDLASALVQAQSLGILASTLGNKDNSVLSHLMAHLNEMITLELLEPTLLNEILILSFEQIYQISIKQNTTMFSKIDFQPVKIHLTSKKEEKNNVINQEKENELDTTIVTKLTEDITFDFQLASLKQDVNSWVDSAYNNPRMFLELLSLELAMVDPKINKDRANLYQSLLTGLINFPGYNQCCEILRKKFPNLNYQGSTGPITTNIANPLGELFEKGTNVNVTAPELKPTAATKSSASMFSLPISNPFATINNPFAFLKPPKTATPIDEFKGNLSDQDDNNKTPWYDPLGVFHKKSKELKELKPTTQIDRNNNDGYQGYGND